MTVAFSYHVLAADRARGLRNRLGFALLIAVAAATVSAPLWPAAWLGVAVLSHLLNDWVGEQARRDPDFVPSRGWERRYLAVSALHGVVLAAIAPYCWFAGGMEGRLFALVILMGGMLSVTVQSEISRPLLVAACAPFLLALAGLPVVTVMVEPGSRIAAMGFLGAGALLYMMHILAAVRRREDLAVALRAALSEAEVERARAERASAAKSEFLATMSHEIRTPLNGVLGMTQAMAQDSLPKRQRERLDVVRQSGEVLLVLLNDLLDISKIEAAKLELDLGALDFEELARQAAAAFEPLTAAKGLALQIHTTPAVAGAWRADPNRVRQILYNLLSNAVKFTEAGRVSAHIDAAEGRVSLRVADTGPGVSKRQLAGLFERFSQADATTTRRYGGSGLGLAISRDLARLMGGDITAESRLGEGSTFIASLPLERTDVVAAAPAPQPAERGAVRVLVAEDNETNRLVLTTLLAQVGIFPQLTFNGAEALEAWQGADWDLVLMDIQMPIMDGVSATRRIRQIERETGRPHTPILALTANAMAHQVAEYEEAGFDAVSAKPIQFSQLLEAMDAALLGPHDKPALAA